MVTFLPPSEKLKRKIGAHNQLDQMLTPKVLEQAAQVMESKKDDIIKAVKSELDGIAKLIETPSADTLHKIREHIFAVKSAAGMGEYTLASAVANNLFVYLEPFESMEAVDIDAGKLFKVITPHYQALLVIFSQNITKDGGDQGMELLNNLQKLVEKMQDQ